MHIFIYLSIYLDFNWKTSTSLSWVSNPRSAGRRTTTIFEENNSPYLIIEILRLNNVKILFEKSGDKRLPCIKVGHI